VKQYFPEKWDKNMTLRLDKDISPDCVLAGPRVHTHAMIVSKKAAKHFLKTLSPIISAIDVQHHFPDVCKGLKYYASKKNLIYQRHDYFESKIQR
jgi:hypothetical protein